MSVVGSDHRTRVFHLVRWCPHNHQPMKLFADFVLTKSHVETSGGDVLNRSGSLVSIEWIVLTEFAETLESIHVGCSRANSKSQFLATIGKDTTSRGVTNRALVDDGCDGVGELFRML